jgi:beta-glucanase (GH16 family)
MKLSALWWLASFLISLSASLNAAPPDPSSWELSFADEFESPALDTGKWTIREGKRRDGLWSKLGVVQNGDGFLRIRTVIDGGNAHGTLRHKPRFEQRYGYFEARCKLPRVAGHWPAFWLLAREFGKTSDAKRLGRGRYLRITRFGNVHFAVHQKYWLDLQSRKRVVPLEQPSAFHDFGLLWEHDRYVFLIDGKKTWEVIDGVSGVAHYVLLSNEVGPWAGPLDKASLPDEMVCDYVRVYRKRE